MAPLLAALVLLVGCRAAPPEPPPPEPTAVPVPAPAPPPPPVRAELCPTLARIVDAEREGFQALRNGLDGQDLWIGTAEPGGLTACRIRGSHWPGAVYECRVDGARAGEARRLLPMFASFAARLDACLAEPYWYPREWQRGQIMELSRGERFLQWHDNSRLPRPILVLKLEENLDLRRFELVLRVQTFR